MERRFHMKIFRLFHAQRAELRPMGAALGLGAGQPKLLNYLSVHGSCMQKELADYFEVDPAAISRMLAALERGGFITRDAGAPRKRCGLVELTDKGRKAASDWAACCERFDERLLRGFSEAEREQFADYLGRAYRNLRGEEVGETSSGSLSACMSTGAT